MAEPWALRHKALEEEGLHRPSSRAKNLRRAAVPARPVAARDRPPPRARPVDAGLLRPQRRRPRAVRRPARRGRSSRPSIPSWRASSSSSSSAGSTSRRGSTCWPRPWRRLAPRPSRPPPAARRQGRRRLAAVPRTGSRQLGLARARHLRRPRRGRAGPAGLGGGRRLHPAQLQRGLQHGHPRGPGLPAPVPDHDRLPLPRAGRGRGRHRRRADADAVTQRPPRPARTVARRAAPSSGGAGRRLVERDYTWDQQAHRLAVGLPLARRRRAAPGMRRTS